MKPIIRVENLSKQYRLGSQSPAYRTLRESLGGLLRWPRRLFGKAGVPTEQMLWALREVNFDIRPGEAVGVIGRNGAGKSTLLKIVSRITEPTEGQVQLYGRVGSLLEVGTGFHGELTGRENVYLNGAILGMKAAEIARKFDQIVSFAELTNFIDTPVKHYSSGMYLRLAFAVAAHLEPEILVVDEILAVGDAAFQKACLGKMTEVARQGRTVLFVSHHMPSVKGLCDRVIQFAEGRIVRDGSPQEVIDGYLCEMANLGASEKVWADSGAGPGAPPFRLRSLRVLNPHGAMKQVYRSQEEILVELGFELQEVHSALVIGFDLINRDGVVVFKSMHNDSHPRQWPALRKGMNTLRCTIPARLLNGGTYFIAPKVGLHSIAWLLNGEAEVSFEVLLDHGESPFWNTNSPGKFNGVIAPCLPWRSVACPT